MNNKNIRTDLAMEVNELLKETPSSQIHSNTPNGVEVDESIHQNIKITRVKIVSPKGEKTVGKPSGNYITLEIPQLRENDPSIMEISSKQLAHEMESLLNGIQTTDTILVVGLGNWNITADALGPRVISKMMVTRHMTEYLPDQIDDDVRPVCAIAPGVLGITGIETSEIVKGIVEHVKPSFVIAIDSLASRKTDRVSTTIQIADTGITPGSGVGNKRSELSKSTLGVPVIALGVPTVIDAATMTSDAIDLVLQKISESTDIPPNISQAFKSLSENGRNELIENLLYPYIGNLVVTPKEIDDIIDKMATVIANSLNMALQNNITANDYNKYIH